MPEPGMTREEAEAFAEPIFEQCRQQYERNDPLGVVQAVRWSLKLSLPIPEWAAGLAENAVVAYFENNAGAAGRGKSGGLKTQWKRDRMHRIRHQIAEHEMARGGSKAAAFERTADRLAKEHPWAWGQPRQIRDSYNKVRAALGDA